MALAANALLTLEEARAWLDIQAADAALALEEEINRASEAIEAYCDRLLKRRTTLAPCTELLVDSGSRLLRVTAGPIDVTAAVTVTFRGAAQTVWRAVADGATKDKDVVVGYVRDGTFRPGKPLHGLFEPDALYRKDGWSGAELDEIVVAYTGGLAAVPEDLKEATLLLVQKLWRDRQKQLADVSTINTPSGSVTILDRLPLLHRQTLDSRYRRWAVA